MKKLTIILAAAVSVLWGSSALADASCSDPSEDGNTWNLICAADNEGDSTTEYQCDYILSVTNAGGITAQAEASGSVGKGLSGVIIWSNVRYQNADITAVSIVSGECTTQ
jgi:hypothetical protein